MSKIAGVHHICLKTAGRPAWEAAIAFYTQVLGCPVVRSWGEGDGSGAMLDLGNCLLEVFADADEPLAPGVHRHVAFRTDDVDGVVELVRQAGCAVTMEPADKALGEGYPIRVAFCRGPAGESIEFFQER
ncbi:MAG: VOC family protein [Oscillospiraceae bacterium]